MRCLYDLNMCDGLVGSCKVLLRLLIGDRRMNVNERNEDIQEQTLLDSQDRKSVV